MKHLSSAFKNLLKRHPNSSWHDAFVGHCAKYPIFKLSEPPLPIDPNTGNPADHYATLFELAAEAFAKGELPFPYSQFNVDCPCGPSSSANLIVNVFELDVNGTDCWAIRIALFADDEIETCPYTFLYVKRDLTLWTWVGPAGALEPPLSDEDRNFAGGTIVIIMNLLMLLRMSYANVEKINIDDENRRRRRMNRPPFPEQHIVTIDVDKLAGVQRCAGGDHTSPVGHLRRAHLRRLTNGKIIEIRSALIKGGPASQMSYAIH